MKAARLSHFQQQHESHRSSGGLPNLYGVSSCDGSAVFPVLVLRYRPDGLAVGYMLPEGFKQLTKAFAAAGPWCYHKDNMDLWESSKETRSATPMTFEASEPTWMSLPLSRTLSSGNGKFHILANLPHSILESLDRGEALDLVV